MSNTRVARTAPLTGQPSPPAAAAPSRWRPPPQASGPSPAKVLVGMRPGQRQGGGFVRPRPSLGECDCTHKCHTGMRLPSGPPPTLVGARGAASFVRHIDAFEYDGASVQAPRGRRSVMQGRSWRPPRWHTRTVRRGSSVVSKHGGSAHLSLAVESHGRHGLESDSYTRIAFRTTAQGSPHC